MFSKIRKIVAWVTVILFLILLAIPLVLYDYSLGLVGSMPEKSKIPITQKEIQELWYSKEHCTPKECASVTPYWPYRWLADATINDLVRPNDINVTYGNMSIMSSQIALHHMRKGHFNGRRMFWWHITHAYLSIWLQRNWSANEIASKFKAISA